MNYLAQFTPLTSLIFCLLLWGCKNESAPTSGDSSSLESPVNVEGQIFVVRKNRQNVRLGAVQVRLIDRAVFNKRLKETAENYRLAKGLSLYQKEIKKFEEKLLDYQVGTHGEYTKQAAVLAHEVIEAYRRDLKANPQVEQLRDEILCHDRVIIQDLFTNTPFDGDTMHSYCLALLFHDKGAKLAHQITTTDADGRFKLLAPAGGDFLITAHASRALMSDETENSYWIYEITPETAGEIILSTPKELDVRDMNLFLTECGADTRMKSRAIVENELGAKDIAWRSRWMNGLLNLIQAERTKKGLEEELKEKKRLLDSYAGVHAFKADLPLVAPVNPVNRNARGEAQIGPELHILKATYGANETHKDVTSIVKGMINEGRLRFSARSDNLGGDPYFGHTKTLKIKYKSSGVEHEKSVREGDWVSLP